MCIAGAEHSDFAKKSEQTVHCCFKPLILRQGILLRPLSGAISEVFGAIAVVLTLIYLAAQIQQNTESGRDAAMISAISNFAYATEELNRDPDLVKIYFDGRKDFHALQQLEKQRFALYMTTVCYRFEIVLHQARQGQVDEQALNMSAQMKDAFEGAGTREWWKGSRYLFKQEFQEYGDALISGIENNVDA